MLNLTDDSFYAASRADAQSAAVRALAMFEQGAAVVDVGAESTRPGAKPVSSDEQIRRLTAFIDALKTQGGFSLVQKISVDTRDIHVMCAMVSLGVKIINDVSGGNPETYNFVAQEGIDYVLMHTQGGPQTMQVNPQYKDVVAEVESYLCERSDQLLQMGALQHKIIWDVGIGFGKTVSHNLALLKASARFESHGFRVLWGVSRKSFIGKILGEDDAANRLYGTLALQTYLTLRGSSILRVHDVKAMADSVCMLDALKNNDI